MVRFSREILVQESPERVWDVLADFPNVYRWAPIIDASRQVSTNAQGVGAERACEVPGFGEMKERVIAWDDGGRLTYTWSASGPVRGGESEWTVAETSKGTLVRVDVRAEMRFGGFGELLGHVVLKPKMGRMMDQTLAGLRHFLTTGEEVTGDVAKRVVAGV